MNVIQRKQRLGTAVLVLTVVTVLILGVSGVIAQSENETTSTNKTTAEADRVGQESLPLWVPSVRPLSPDSPLARHSITPDRPYEATATMEIRKTTPAAEEVSNSTGEIEAKRATDENESDVSHKSDHGPTGEPVVVSTNVSAEDAPNNATLISLEQSTSENATTTDESDDNGGDTATNGNTDNSADSADAGNGKRKRTRVELTLTPLRQSDEKRSI